MTVSFAYDPSLERSPLVFRRMMHPNPDQVRLTGLAAIVGGALGVLVSPLSLAFFATDDGASDAESAWVQAWAATCRSRCPTPDRSGRSRRRRPAPRRCTGRGSRARRSDRIARRRPTRVLIEPRWIGRVAGGRRVHPAHRHDLGVVPLATVQEQQSEARVVDGRGIEAALHLLEPRMLGVERPRRVLLRALLNCQPPLSLGHIQATTLRPSCRGIALRSRMLMPSDLVLLHHGWWSA
jgi:hypothetical protein